MDDSGYNYVDVFADWEQVLVKNQNEFDEPYNNVCKNIIIADAVKSDKYTNICIFFTKSMDYIAKDSDYTVGSESLNGICAYLNYYLNSEIRNINDSSINAEQFYLNIKAKDTSNSLKLTKCNDKIKNIEYNIFDEMKYIYNLFFNAQKYIYNVKKTYKDKCPFAQKCYTSYKERLYKCYESSSDPFCQKMGKFKERYEYYLKENSCNIPEVLPPFGEKPTAEMQSEDGREGTPSDDISNLLHGKIGTLALTTPGVVIGLSVLYKFTPIGTRISQLLRRKNNIDQNIQEQNYDNPLFNSDNLHRSSSNSNYNITYQQY